MNRCFLALVLFFPGFLLAQNQPLLEQTNLPRYLVRIELHTADELMSLLRRAEVLHEQGIFKVGEDTPIAFVLHGSEAQTLFLANYNENKALVDLAARLSALSVVDIKVCQTWMGGQSLGASPLQPFIGTIPSGPAEKKRLLGAGGYVYF